MVQRVRRYRASMDKEVSWLPSSRTDSQYTLMPGSSSIMGCHCWTIFDDDAGYSGSNTESLDSSTTMSLSFSSSPRYPVLGNDGIHECVTRGAHIGFLLSLPTLATDAQFVPESILSLSGSRAHITKVGTLLAHHLVLSMFQDRASQTGQTAHVLQYKKRASAILVVHGYDNCHMVLPLSWT
jgi:hypothetical protein